VTVAQAAMAARRSAAIAPIAALTAPGRTWTRSCTVRVTTDTRTLVSASPVPPLRFGLGVALAGVGAGPTGLTGRVTRAKVPGVAPPQALRPFPPPCPPW